MTQFLSRSEFLSGFWDYRPGEHVSLIEPTQQGKTYLLWQLLERACEQNPELRTAVLVPKPRDPAAVKWSGRLGFKETPDWPPAKPFPWQTKPNGHVLWPRHIKADEKANNAQLAAKFSKCLSEQYWRGNTITVADDVYLLAVMLDLNPQLEKFWTAGGAMPAGLWSANQKPSGTLGGGSVSSFSYNAPTHLFLGKDRDERNVKRFAEIGGVDPREVESIVRELRIFRVGDHAVSEKLYIDKRGPYMAVIGI